VYRDDIVHKTSNENVSSQFVNAAKQTAEQICMRYRIKRSINGKIYIIAANPPIKKKREPKESLGLAHSPALLTHNVNGKVIFLRRMTKVLCFSMFLCAKIFDGFLAFFRIYLLIYVNVYCSLSVCSFCSVCVYMVWYVMLLRYAELVYFRVFFYFFIRYKWSNGKFMVICFSTAVRYVFVGFLESKGKFFVLY
jgi:hypothetical protein